MRESAREVEINLQKSAFSISKLRYDALARFFDDLSELCIDNNWNLAVDELQNTKGALDKAWQIAEKNASGAELQQYSDSYGKQLAFCRRLQQDKITRLLLRAAKYLNDDAEKDFQKGYNKLVKIMLTDPNSAIRSIRKACGLINLNN